VGWGERFDEKGTKMDKSYPNSIPILKLSVQKIKGYPKKM